MSVSDDRWTCPRCTRTVVVIASPGDTRVCLKAAQDHHRQGHCAAAEVISRLGLPDPIPLKQSTARRRRRRARPC